MSALGDTIANLVIHQFHRLPPRGKPVLRSNGIQEWTILAGIVVESPNAKAPLCVSLATGVKATPERIVGKAQGKVLHDMHAEILCIRAFNRFILNECIQLVGNKDFVSKYVRRIPAKDYQNESSTKAIIAEETDLEPKLKRQKTDNGSQVDIGNDTKSSYLFEAMPGLKTHLYITDAPCGDASLSNTIRNAGETEEWTSPMTPISDGGPLRGRNHFCEVGHVRTKPGRPDSPLTMSKSCSDKLAVRTATGLLSGPVARIVSPNGFYLTSLTVPETQFHESDFERAFGPTGRLKELKENNVSHGKYKPQFFEFLKTTTPFEFERTEDRKPSPQSVLYIHKEDEVQNGAYRNSLEVIINGVKMGSKPLSGKGESMASRYQLYSTVQRLISETKSKSIEPQSYTEFKKGDEDRRQMKQQVYTLLKGWHPTATDDFSI